MPPLLRHGSPGSEANTQFGTYHNIQGYAHLNKKSSRRPSPTDVVSERDIYLGTNPLSEYSLSADYEEVPRTKSTSRSSAAPNSSLLADTLLDSFTSLCLCRFNNEKIATRKGRVKPVFHKSSKRGVAVAISSKKRIVYPIAKYPGRLNNPLLVKQRRKFLEDQAHLSFRPVSEDNMSLPPPSSQHVILKPVAKRSSSYTAPVRRRR